MRTSDPAGYDEFFETSNTTLYSTAFRGLHFTTVATAGAFTIEITLNRSTIATTPDGVQYNTPTTVTKTISVSLPANSSYLLPVSGDRVAITARPTSGRVFVLI